MNDIALNDDGMTELHLAAYHGELDWVQNCIEGGLDVNARDNDEFTPLHWATDMGMVGPDNNEREEIVRLLIEAEADINARDNEGVSVFFRAVMAGNYKIIELLIRAGADIDAADNQGDKPFTVATANEDLEMVRIIKQANNSA